MAAEHSARKSSRLIEIEVAKGLAIALVVIGHISWEGLSEGNEWYKSLHYIIYKFHMPFFMFISGFTMYYSYNNPPDISGYLEYVLTRIKRLAPGFIIFGVAIFLSKSFLSLFIHIDNLPHGPADFVNIFLKPMQSSARSLWYIYVLLEFYIVFPIFIFLVRGNFILLIISSLMLRLLPATHYFCIDLFFEYAFFFSLGIVAVRYYESLKHFIVNNSMAFYLLFVASYLSIFFVSEELSKLIIGTCSVPAIYAFVNLKSVKHSNLLAQFGKYTYAIYLMNTIFIGLTKALFLELGVWDGPVFLLLLPILWSAGLYAPILVKEYLFPKFKYLDRITA